VVRKYSLIFVLQNNQDMIIDVTPQVRQANNIETIAMNLYGETERYVFMRGDVEFSVQFTPKKLKEFIPKKTVSEMLVSWFQGLVTEYERFQKAVDTRQHPTWTTTQKDPEYKGFNKNYQMITVPYSLNDREVENFKGYATKAKAKIQPITFWKIVK
jgi:hypothetical protein